MIQRKIIKELENWAKKPGRKPLVLRGARQVGKTTVVHEFSNQFEQYIYLNLELPEDRKPFEDFTNIEALVEALFFLKKKIIAKSNSTLLFIDEIQEEPKALMILRYFYEQVPEIAVIAAGSLLETIFDKDISFPVGRVEHKVLRPVSFEEFLDSIGEPFALEQFMKIPMDPFAEDKLFSLFHTYALIGGMPEIVNEYSKSKDISSLSTLYDSLITSYKEDIEKYANAPAQVEHIRHAIQSAFSLAGLRIRFEGFGNSSYRSREMGEALRTLEKAMIIELVHPVTSPELPLLPDRKKSPRLHFIDTGLINYFSGVQTDIIGTKDLNSIQHGRIIEHIVGQEILSERFDSLSGLNFWVREKKTSSAEVDYVLAIDGKLIPVEVKSGETGTLKSLHQFMDVAPHTFAIRLYRGKLNLQKTKTQKGTEFHLLNLPYFLGAKIEDYYYWMKGKVKG